jgi:hypothetical protein
MDDTSKTLVVFPDTNVLVQCKPLGELDWSEIGAYSRITLILARPVIGEIDQQKGGTGRLAKRARAANGLLRRLLDQDSVDIPVKKKGMKVTLQSGDHLRASDALDDQLDYTTADDKLVGTVHKYVFDNPSHDVVFLSHDTGPLMTAKRLSVPFQRVPDDWLLSPEADEEQKQIKVLQDQISRYEDQLPKCQIEFIGTPWVFKIPSYRALTENQITTLIRKVENKYPRETIFETQAPQRTHYDLVLTSIGKRFVPVSAKEISDYEDSYTQWLELITEAFRTLNQTFDAVSALPWIEIGLTNSGSTPAKNVEVRAEVAGGKFCFFAPSKEMEKQLEEPPRLPLPPQPPKGRWVELFGLSSLLIDAPERYPLNLDFMRPRAARDANKFYWKDGRPDKPVAQVSRECKEWRHQDDQQIVRLRLVAGQSAELLAGAIRVTIRATNLSQPVQATQPVRFEFEQLDLLEEAEALLETL